MLSLPRCVLFVLCAGILAHSSGRLSAQAPGLPESTNDSTANAEFREFFKRFQALTNQDTADELIKEFDFEMLIESVIEQSQVEVPDGLRNQLITRTPMMTKRQFEALGDKWIRHKIVQTIWNDERTIAEVFVRHWSEDLSTTRTVYSLKRTDSGWKIFDWTDLSLGFSTVSFTAAVLRDSFQTQFQSETYAGMRGLFRAMIAASQGDNDAASDHLVQSTGLAIPPMMESLRWNLRAALQMENDPIYALECLDKVEAFDQGALIASYMRMSANLLLENHDQVVRYARDYLGRFGADADAFHSMGISLTELGREEEAIEAFKAGLDDTPEMSELVEELALVLPDSRKIEFVKFAKRLPSPIENFEYLADSFEIAEDSAALKTLIDAGLAVPSGIPHLDYYQAVVLIEEGHLKKAYSGLIQSIRGTEIDPDYREWYENLLGIAAVDIGKSAEAYQACQNKSEMVAMLRRLLLHKIESEENPQTATAKKHAKQIETILGIYLEEFADDPHAWTTIANFHMQSDRYEQAIESFQKALELLDSSEGKSEDLYDLIPNLVECYLHLDRPVEGYNAVPDKPTAFRNLYYELDDDSKEYLRIAELHRKQFPNDLFLNALDVEQLYSEGQYSQALKIAESAIKLDSEDADDWQIQNVRFFHVLCLAQLKRTDDAIIASRSGDIEQRDFLRTLIYGIKGDKPRFREAYLDLAADAPDTGPDWFSHYATIPEDWFPEIPAQQTREFNRSDEVRRLVFLLNEPITVGAFSVSRASETIGERLFETNREELTSANSDFICELNDRATLVSVDRCKYFLSTGDTKYAGTDELAIENDALIEAIEQHQAWFAIDIYAWPQDLDTPSTDSIPLSAVERMVRLAKQFAGQNATVAIHPDSVSAILCSDPFYDSLSQGDLSEAFFPETAQ